jgi:uncharacterized SAM-binding protein YcdF (DUF218 family)
VFLAASKLLDVLLSPLAWALALLVAALLARRSPRRASALAALAAATLYASASPLVANAAARAVEAGAVRTARDGAIYEVAVVLSGSVDAAATAASGELQLGDAAERVLAAWELLREGRARHVLLSGGPPDPRPGAVVEAEVVAARLRAWGADPSRILVEGASRNTRENAVASARIVRERGFRSVLLVTSAAHLPRALGCFRAAGLEPDALPVDRRAGEVRVTVDSFLPRAHALATTTEAVREWAGRLVYRAVGYSR